MIQGKMLQQKDMYVTMIRLSNVQIFMKTMIMKTSQISVVLEPMQQKV